VVEATYLGMPLMRAVYGSSLLRDGQAEAKFS
jgi:hypothetical protein